MSDVLLAVIKSVCMRYGVGEIILFGSRAKFTNHPRSDYDIAVRGVEDEVSLYNAIEDIDTLYKIDLVNLDKVHNQLLLEEVEKYGITL